MTVLDVLKVMLPDAKVKIYNDNVAWSSGKLRVSEALELPNLDTLPVGCIWRSDYGAIIIEVEDAE